MQLKTNSAYWRSCSEHARSFKLSAKNKQLIKQRRTLTSSSNRLWLFIQFMKIITRDTHNSVKCNIHGEWLWFIVAETDTNFRANMQWFHGQKTDGCQNRIPTKLQSFCAKTGPMLSRDLQSMCIHLWHTAKICEKFSESSKPDLQC